MLEHGGQLSHSLALPPFLVSFRIVVVFVEHRHEVHGLVKEQGAHALLRARVRVACEAGDGVCVSGGMQGEGKRGRSSRGRTHAAAPAAGRAGAAAHACLAGLDMLCLCDVCVQWLEREGIEEAGG